MGVIQPVTKAQFTDRVVRMGVVRPPASAAAAMEGLLREGICSDAARQWLHHKPEVAADRNQLLAAIYRTPGGMPLARH
jgi:hypothetical protein